MAASIFILVIIGKYLSSHLMDLFPNRKYIIVTSAIFANIICNSIFVFFQKTSLSKYW